MSLEDAVAFLNKRGVSNREILRNTGRCPSCGYELGTNPNCSECRQHAESLTIERNRQ